MTNICGCQRPFTATSARLLRSDCAHCQLWEVEIAALALTWDATSDGGFTHNFGDKQLPGGRDLKAHTTFFCEGSAFGHLQDHLLPNSSTCSTSSNIQSAGCAKFESSLRQGKRDCLRMPGRTRDQQPPELHVECTRSGFFRVAAG